MKFTRMERRQDFAWTDRKLALHQKKSQRIRAKLEKEIPLFANQVELQTLTPEQEAERRHKYNRQREQSQRDLAARMWRDGRALVRQLTPEQKTKFFAFWNRRSSHYQQAHFLRSFVEMFNGEAARKMKKIDDEQRCRRAKIDAQIQRLRDADMFLKEAA